MRRSVGAREGDGVGHCEKCQRDVAEWPNPKKKARRAKMPVGTQTVVDGYELDGDETKDFQAVGGVA